MRLRSEIKDNFTLKDMLGSVEKEMENRRETPMPVEEITEWMNRRTPFPGKRDTAHPGTDQTQRADPRKRSAFQDGTARPPPLQGEGGNGR
ncbi:hypothetical protein NXW04_12085 [Phocaeicola vulgatus]|nr:hypothetical protein [Phocaeicola vulgatus]